MSTYALEPSRIMIGRPARRRHLGLWLAPVTFVILTSISLLAGFTSASGSSYWSAAQIFEDFMNSPLRILFPIGAALLAGTELSAELSHRAILNTRTREGVRHHLRRVFTVALLRTFTVFALVGLVNAIAALFIVPAIWPHVIDPHGYGLSSASAVHAADVAIAPLAAAASLGSATFAIVSAVWLGLNGVAFGLLALVAVVFISRPVLALLVPAGVYLAESIVFMFVGMPGPSFLVSAVYPAGLQHYSLLQAVLPTALLLIVTAIVAAVVIVRSPTSARMS